VPLDLELDEGGQTEADRLAIEYVAASASGVRLLEGRLRATAALSLALVAVVLAFSGPYVAAPAGIALLALAFVSARAGGAAWRGSSAAAGCRAGRSLEAAPASRSAG
jgi:hypothetical protein